MVARPDLNLLVALHALLEERHVSRAAERIGVTQPAASAMLGRLRRHFDDELLERVGNRYQLTPLGAQLQEQAGSVLELSDRLFATKSQFEPATSEREFTLSVADYTAAVLGPRLLDAFEKQAPRATLRFRRLGMPETHPGEDAEPTVDGLIAPHGSLFHGMPNLPLFTDEWVALVDRDNPAADNPPSTEDLAVLNWVLGQFDPHNAPFMLQRLTETGRQLRPHAVTDSFLALPLYITGTDRIAVLQRRLTEAMPLPSTLRVIPCPFDAGPINEALWWHPVHTHDAGHRWLRTLIQDTARHLDQDAEPAR
ncbi:LysR family transcriptional regulator [Kitasatospora sp. NPDC005856]|uniref:LysR family transcriptional regulator n=1 Tax=Kitasatospora sp. NPDC005856 TaxID=3154566 RepID=UPI0033D8D884